MKAKIIKSLKIIFTVIILFVTLVVVINTSPFDEKLKPEVLEILTEPSYPQVEGNAYFAVLGFNAQKGKDMNQTGHQIIQYYIENRANENDSLLDTDYDEILGQKLTINSKVKDFLGSCNLKENASCLTELSENLDENLINDDELTVLLSRYSQITQMNFYHNYLDGGFDVPLPYFFPLMKTSQIHLINSYKNQSQLEFIQQLLIDMNYWKKMLGESTLLIDKMVAINGIRIDTIFLSEFIKTQEFNIQLLPEINQILSSLTSKQLDLSQSFIAESRLMFEFGKLIEKDLSFFENLLFQPNASSNYHYEHNLKNQLQWSQKPLSQYITDRKSKQDYVSPSRLHFHFLYNFIGKSLIENVGPAIDDYVARIYDVNNMFNLVKIQLQLKMSETQNIQQILSKPENINPYDGKPFDYDKEKGLLSFESLEDFSKYEIKL